MHLQSKRYPIDLLICILLSVLIIPIVVFDLEQTIRILLGLPFLLFIPGYVLVFALFPQRKTDRGIDSIERIALSFGLSIAVVPLIGLGLNYTPWGIRLIPILLSLVSFNLLMSSIAWYRWRQVPEQERFIIDIHIKLPHHESRVDQLLSIILVLSIIAAMAALLYVIVTPKVGEQFTELYLLGEDGVASDYPQEAQVGENITVTVGVVNHEYETMNYTLEAWLVNQSLVYSNETGENQTMYHGFWFVDVLTIELEHVPVDIEEPWEKQWEYNWTLPMDYSGTLKLAFLLYTNSTQTYEQNVNYASLAQFKFEHAYRSVHLWITVED